MSSSPKVRSGRRSPRPYTIRRRAQVEALVSPVRQEIVDTLLAAGPRSAAELAALMGRPADALYYHLRKLARVGLVVPGGSRRRGRRVEAVYDLVGRPLVLAYPAGRDARTPLLRRLAASMLRTAGRDFDKAMTSGGAAVSGGRRTLWATRRHAWLAPADVRRVNRVLAELLELLGRSRRPDRGALCTLTFVLAPRTPRGARRASPPRATRARAEVP